MDALERIKWIRRNVNEKTEEYWAMVAKKEKEEQRLLKEYQNRLKKK